MYDCLYDFGLFAVYQLFNLFERKNGFQNAKCENNLTKYCFYKQ